MPLKSTPSNSSLTLVTPQRLHCGASGAVQRQLPSGDAWFLRVSTQEAERWSRHRDRDWQQIHAWLRWRGGQSVKSWTRAAT